MTTRHTMGSGPFKMKEYVRGSTIELEPLVVFDDQGKAHAGRKALAENDGIVPQALVCLLTGCTPERARAALAAHTGIRQAISAARVEHA
jgi:hypothetical protein